MINERRILQIFFVSFVFIRAIFSFQQNDQQNLTKILDQNHLNNSTPDQENEQQQNSENEDNNANDSLEEMNQNMEKIEQKMKLKLQKKQEKEKLYEMKINKKKLGLITEDKEFFDMPTTCHKYFNLGTTIQTTTLAEKNLKPPEEIIDKYKQLLQDKNVQSYLKKRFRKIAKNSQNKTIEILNQKIKHKKALAKITQSPYYKFESLPALTEQENPVPDVLYELSSLYVEYIN